MLATKVITMNRKLVTAHKEALKAQLDAESNPANAFHLGVMLLYVSKIGQMLHVPGKMIVDVLQVCCNQRHVSAITNEPTHLGIELKSQ